MLTKKSFAKINLYLEVNGRSQNGYRLLNSLMVLIDIFDLITIQKSDGLELEIKTEKNILFSQNWQQNIIIKTTNLLAEKFGFTPKIKITLEKHIPIAAGLGGGSSNAAVVMLLLNDFYQLNLSKKQLLELGLKIGADVPFFLNSYLKEQSQNKLTFVSGVGEVLQDCSVFLPDFYLLIVNPKKSLSTKEVFDLFAKEAVYKPYKINEDANFDLLKLIKNHCNDLEKPATKMMPEIALILDAFRQQEKCLLGRMSGSGASCFGIFSNSADLENCYHEMQKTFPEFYLKKSKFIFG